MKHFKNSTNTQLKKNDPFGLKFFDGAPFNVEDEFYVAIITPVLHYTMGGVEIGTDAAVLTSDHKSSIPGVFAGGEVAGGVHGLNRLGGSSLLDCVVFGRVAGASAAKYLLSQTLKGNTSGSTSSGGGNQSVTIQVKPDQQCVTLDFHWNGQPQGQRSSSTTSTPSKSQSPSSYKEEEDGPKEKASSGTKEYTLSEVAKHNKNDDCWVAINGEVLNVTPFLDDHPGGRKAIMLYAGKDASEEFNMLHEKNVIKKYAPSTIIGVLKQ